MTDAQLITLCQQQDRRAQRLLYDRYSKAMYTTAYRITGDFDWAGEAIQDAFLQVFRHIGSFGQRSTLGAWIKSIVVRTALQKVNRRQNRFDAWEDDQVDTVLDWGSSPIDAMLLEQAIQQLPEGARAVFVLAEVEGYAHREIAEMLGVSEGTSKSQLSAAKKRLRELLSPQLSNF
jgi:RNA polymerase sigma factor (sigma-70 family)